MKAFLILACFFLSLTTAKAAKKVGSECGLTVSMGDEAWKKVGKWMPLSTATEKKLNALPTLTKQQLIITAKEEAVRFEENVTIRNTVEAVNYLKQNSESGDLSMQDYSLNGKRYTEVIFYPGGNPYGALFVKNTLRIVAFNEDDTLYCK